MKSQNDAYYSTMDHMISIINRKLPKEMVQDTEVLEKLLDEVLLHFKFEAMEKERD